MAHSATFRSLLIAGAVAVGVFHGYMKPDLDQRQIARLEDYVARMDQWEGRFPEDFELERLDGGSLRLSEQIGERVILLNFFATWCGPCREEMPELDRFAGEIGGEKLLVVGIDVAESREVVEGFLAAVPVSFPIALDPHGETAEDYGVSSYPTTVVIGLDGRIGMYQVGAISNADVTFATVLAEQEVIRQDGLAISEEDYLAGLAEQPRLGGSDEVELTGRALEIARAMPCPCGCEQLVHECECQTADKITARLAEIDLEGVTDQEVMESLNKEFCVGATS